MHAHTVRRLLLVAAILLSHVPSMQAQSTEPISAAQKNAALFQLLREEVDLSAFATEKLNLREFFELLKEIYRKRGKELTIIVDDEAYKMDNPDAADIRDTLITLRPRGCGVDLVRNALGQLPGNFAFLLRNGIVEITVRENTRSERLIAEKVHASFEQQPLRQLLAELSALSGVSIIVDPYAGKGISTPVTGTFHGDVTLLSAVAIVCDMADLKPIVVDGGIYVTSPTRGRQMLNHLWQQQSTVIRSQFGRMTLQERQYYALQQIQPLSEEILLRALFDGDPIIRWAAHVAAQERNYRRIVTDPFASTTMPPQ